MRESRTYGSVRGVLSNGPPYRDNEITATDRPWLGWGFLRDREIYFDA
jgi:hypothetical protein